MARVNVGVRLVSTRPDAARREHNGGANDFARELVVIAAHGHSPPETSDQCVAGLLGRNKISDGDGIDEGERGNREGGEPSESKWLSTLVDRGVTGALLAS
ncbi:hypothetical protein EVAR_28126_1 [Eumeta japonica]|uniref:Uncharacterized protein n=1 Tax=Eumeta variegata TaxID=151549 RepID=A0A4C1VGE4_EUMVA|nr:hypothetical protein EVAR_28126_1 [Eumeta japonica]